jgi:hypothetical protein
MSEYATAVSMEVDLPKVPLEAGLGPENPPCPACGEPLFPWLELPGGKGLARRCEACGLGVLAETGDSGLALTDFDLGRTDDGLIAFDNKASFQASLTGAGWAGLETERSYRFTPEAVARLVAFRDQKVVGRKLAFGRSLIGMWQSAINTFTFGHNVALGTLGDTPSVDADRGWKRAIDWFITVVLAVPVFILALPLEALATLVGRAGCYRVELEVL